MNRRGFTLLELLVVLAIIGLLVALLLQAVQAVRESARRAQCSSRVRGLVLAHQQYHDVYNCFPIEWARGLRPTENRSSILSGATPAEFQCPSNVNEADMSGAGLTPYGHNMFLVGEAIARITDGTSNTVLHGEFTAHEGTAWFSSPGLTSVNCTSAHTRGAHYGLADGSVRFLTGTLAEDVRAYLILPDDGEAIELP